MLIRLRNFIQLSIYLHQIFYVSTKKKCKYRGITRTNKSCSSAITAVNHYENIVSEIRICLKLKLNVFVDIRF